MIISKNNNRAILIDSDATMSWNTELSLTNNTDPYVVLESVISSRDLDARIDSENVDEKTLIERLCQTFDIEFVVEDSKPAAHINRVGSYSYSADYFTDSLFTSRLVDGFPITEDGNLFIEYFDASNNSLGEYQTQADKPDDFLDAVMYFMPNNSKSFKIDYTMPEVINI